jgi:ribose transport system permease protein
MVTLFKNGWSIPLVIAVCVVMSLIMGFLNGLLVVLFRINSMMATFATQSIFAGLALTVMKKPGGSIPQGLYKWFAARVFGFFPMALIVVTALVLLVLVILGTPLGIQLYAIGNNEEKAYISGVRVSYVRCFAHVFSGFSAGIAAICYTAYTGGGDPTAAMTLTLSCIAVCVIGGLSLNGGKGSFIGVLWGALFLQMIISIILSARIPTKTQDLVRGLILLVGIAGTLMVFGPETTRKERGRCPANTKQGG